MKVVCGQDELVAKLGIVSRGVSQRSTVQILSGILLRADGEAVELAATDMELSLRVGLEARVEEAGSTVVPGRLIHDITRLLPAGEEVVLEQPASTRCTRRTPRTSRTCRSRPRPGWTSTGPRSSAPCRTSPARPRRTSHGRCSRGSWSSSARAG